MSRGFVKEGDQEEIPMVLPRAFLPTGTPNYVTPEGLKLLQEEMEVLKKQWSDAGINYVTKNYIDAKMRLLSERINNAVLVDHAKANPDVVSFGMYVRYNDKVIRIVGVDEADASKGLVSFISPIAKALIGRRKGEMINMEPAEAGHTKVEFKIPARGLIGYRSNFITNTKGEGIMVRSFDSYRPYAGEIFGRKNGVLVTMETGKTFGYALYNLLDRGTMIVEPSTDVYEGMIVGIHNRDNDLNVNPCKNKQLTNTRASGSDEAIALIKPKTFSLEEALEFIQDDELVEVTPTAIRLRKKILDPNERFRVARK